MAHRHCLTECLPIGCGNPGVVSPRIPVSPSHAPLWDAGLGNSQIGVLADKPTGIIPLYYTHYYTHYCMQTPKRWCSSLPPSLSLSPDIIVNPVPSLDCQWNCNKNPPESSPPLLTIGHFVRSNWLVLSPCPGQVGLWEGGREEPTLCMASLAWPGLVFLFTKITFRSGREWTALEQIKWHSTLGVLDFRFNSKVLCQQ